MPMQQKVQTMSVRDTSVKADVGSLVAAEVGVGVGHTSSCCGMRATFGVSDPGAGHTSTTHGTA
jgi:hypothetical protein